MAGVTQYTDEEIRFVLYAIVTKVKQAKFKEDYEIRFKKKLGNNQIRYIKNKYGRDARYGSVMVNYRGQNAADLDPSFSSLRNAGSTRNNPVDLTTTATSTTTVPATANSHTANIQPRPTPSSQARGYSESPALSTATPAATPYAFVPATMPPSSFFQPGTGYASFPPTRPLMNPYVNNVAPTNWGIAPYPAQLYQGFRHPGMFMSGPQQPQGNFYGAQGHFSVGMNLTTGPPFVSYGPVPNPVTPSPQSFINSPDPFQGENLVRLRTTQSNESIKPGKSPAGRMEETVLESIEQEETMAGPVEDALPELEAPDHGNENIKKDPDRPTSEDLVDALIEKVLFEADETIHADQTNPDDIRDASLEADKLIGANNSSAGDIGDTLLKSVEANDHVDEYVAASTTSETQPANLPSVGMQTMKTAHQNILDIVMEDDPDPIIDFGPSIDFDHQLYPDPGWQAGLVTSYEELLNLLVWD